jgi:tetratricopeptide (TPR) repeat protein
VNDQALFPRYIPRGAEEERIRAQARQVREDGKSRVVLLYGPGGVGKTQLVRHLADTGGPAGEIAWVEPIDIDDSQFWLLLNLERRIAEQIDPRCEYFGEYLDYLSRFPRYARPPINQETVVSHLGRIKQVFIDGYRTFIEMSGRTVVITFDTVEVIRDMYLLVTLTQLMKALPGTLFILAGRPAAAQAGRSDAIEEKLADPYRGVPATIITLGDFDPPSSRAYLDASGIASGISADERSVLARLTRGHPLLLAFTVSYLHETGLPQEAAASPEEIERVLPDNGDPTRTGQNLYEEFSRRLVARYHETDFWHEAIRRLAVARENISRSIWSKLMSDRPLPEGVPDPEAAWSDLLELPWIRPRASGQYVTLHDAVAEELARRIIPLHDPSRQWRLQIWRRAADAYRDRIESREAELLSDRDALEGILREWDGRSRGDGEPERTEEEISFVEAVGRLDVEWRELCQFKAVRLYYELLCDSVTGCRLFLELLEQAKRERDVLFQELLVSEMQRFLPGGVTYAFGDVVGERIGEFRDWLSSQAQDLYLEIGVGLVDQLIRSEQPEAALDLLDGLPAPVSHRDSYRLSNLRGNACMRIPGKVKDGLDHFTRALAEAQAMQSQTADSRLVAKAHKELGFYYRNEGLWQQADDAYRDARDAISATLTVGSPDEDREEMASIQTNWAYVKGLTGAHREGTNLVESAISVRRRQNRLQEEGSSWSVCGEVYRYERRFQMAWQAYARAEQIFEGLRNWSWLGQIYQEQAICLFQAAQEGIILSPGADPVAEAKRLIKQALDLCQDLAIRSYPSALNRAGRIFGAESAEDGLRYLHEGISWARRLSDGWFLFANLIEYVELCYQAWAETGQDAYRARIEGHAGEIATVSAEYEFPDLKGRWNLLQGHLRMRDWLRTRDDTGLDLALPCYKDGFAQIAQQFVGSSGATAIAGEFTKFRELITLLPDDTRARWLDEFRRAWSQEAGSTLLLARLEELY